jgi:hypothetical protein
MKTRSRSIALTAALAHLMAACAATPPLPAATPVARIDAGAAPAVDATATRAVAIRVIVEGDQPTVIDDAGSTTLRLRAADKPVEYGLAVENGALAAYALPPGRYALTGIGPLTCRGASFEVLSEDDILLLGTVRFGAGQAKDGTVPIAVAPPESADHFEVIAAMQAEPTRLQPRPVALGSGAGCQPPETGPTAGATVGAVVLGAALLVVLLPLAVLTSGDLKFKHK